MKKSDFKRLESAVQYQKKVVELLELTYFSVDEFYKTEVVTLPQHRVQTLTKVVGSLHDDAKHFFSVLDQYFSCICESVEK